MTCSWTSALFFLFSAVRDLVLVDVSEILLGRRCIFGPRFVVMLSEEMLA